MICFHIDLPRTALSVA